MIEKNIFDPALLSFPDCDFLLAEAGNVPAVALAKMPPICNRTTMTEWVHRFYELQEVEKVTGQKWAGVQAVKRTIQVYLDQRKKWAREVEYGAPKYPSMYTFDSRGNAHEGAPGSDCGRVKTYFDENGNRLPFALNLVDSSNYGAWKPEWVAKVKPNAVDTPALILPEGKNCIECGVAGCGHTETYRVDNRSSFNAARGRMSKHLRSAKSEKEAHLELHTLEFGSSSR